ncbi:MAG TPA: hypothetical protein VFH15_03760 [Pyrinomonadaceae bacterium]|nr:hypothetical protein [Pyrinomonadaceae bacterium]
MSETVKSNAEILSDQRAFSETFARAREVFGKIEGVTSVGLGQKRTGGDYTDKIVILVQVKEKKKEVELPVEQRIPPVFEGYRTDVVVAEVAELLKCDNTDAYDVIQGGIQVVPTTHDEFGNFEEGTLGCIVRRRGDTGRENVYLLTCSHVLVHKDFQKGDVAYHPFAPPPRSSIPAKGPSTGLGKIQDHPFFNNRDYQYIINGVPKTDDFFLDCAIARIQIDSKCWDDCSCTKDTQKYDTTIIDLQLVKEGANLTNYISDVRSVIEDTNILSGAQNTVFKVGRTTGRTVGKVRTLGSTPFKDPENPARTLQADNVIGIELDTSTTPVNCKGNANFAERGDSGSLVLDAQGRAIGLLFLGPTTPGGLAFACHIHPVLDNLNVCIPTKGGTSHGSCGATDGSGTAPATTVTGLELPDGQIVFTSTPPVAVDPSPGFPDPSPLLDQEVDHMRDLLKAFRETEKGRELHEVFGQVRREIGDLIRNCRPVTVAWHRNQGPAFFAHLLNHLRGFTPDVPVEIKGVTRETLLTRMAVVLAAHSSNPLQEAIAKYREFLPVVLNLNSADDCIAYLYEKENS